MLYLGVVSYVVILFESSLEYADSDTKLVYEDTCGDQT